jgi:hypothetical protein
MAGLPRKFQPLFAGNLVATPSGNIAVPGSRALGTELYNSDIAVLMGTAAWLNGWAGIVVGNNSPIKQEFNAILLSAFQQLAYIFERGIPEWDSQTQYNTGDFAKGVGNRQLYFSLQDNNVNIALGNNAWWIPYESLFDAAGSAAAAQSAAEAFSSAALSFYETAVNPQLAKAWLSFKGDGTIYNGAFATLGIAGTGNYTVNFTAPFTTLPAISFGGSGISVITGLSLNAVSFTTNALVGGALVPTNFNFNSVTAFGT